MPVIDDSARTELRARQGAGARYDAPSAPAEDLLLARRGTAFFARKLMELDDSGLFQPSAVPGLTRAHVVAKVSYAARAHALAFDMLTGADTGDYDPNLDIGLATTFPARALRHLFKHSEVHLNVCWRDLSSVQWDQTVTLPDGTGAVARMLPLRRAAMIWQSAIDLGNGASVRDMPEGIKLG